MQYMILRKSDASTEAGELPGPALLAAMGAYNEELAKAGMLLGGEGLQASSKGALIRFSGGKPTVTDGPFTEAKELIAGFTMIEAASREEVLNGSSAGRRKMRTAIPRWKFARAAARAACAVSPGKARRPFARGFPPLHDSAQGQ
jgi:hypothetical protein